MNEDLLAKAIVEADKLPPRRWMAKYGAINLTVPTHLTKNYKEIREDMQNRVPKFQVELD